MQRRVAGLWLSVALGAVTACSNETPAPIAPSPSADRAAAGPNADASEGDGPLTIAVIGDIPYGPVKRAEFPSLIALINDDPAVDMVFHAGDIKAGKATDCSDAYFADIRSLFDTFIDPLVYTPGDNEWTDCHVFSKNNGLYTPTERLEAVRALFFPNPGRTLGIHSRDISTQATDPDNSDYVENTMFIRSHVVFAALNITGSNNDLASWGTPLPANAANYPSQAEESASRAQANSAWLARTFALAEQRHAAAVVLLAQADMWDPTEPTLTGFDDLVSQLGQLAAHFGKPVLLLEGDSHVFHVDNPFAASSPFHGFHPVTPIADNVTRIVVEGSDKGRTEYLRLHIDPAAQSVSPFSWERVPLN